MDEEFLRMLQKHNQDLYLGNGKPALTIRMALVEKEQETMNRAAEEIKKDHKTIRNMVIGLILTVIGEIIVKLVMH